MTDTVTTADIAAALGVSGRAIRKRASHPCWPDPISRIKSGGNVYELAPLPISKTELRRVKKHLLAQQARPAPQVSTRPVGPADPNLGRETGVLVATKDIAVALGVSRQAIAKRAKKQGWQPTDKRVQGGGNVYELVPLPLTISERKRVARYLRDQQEPAPTVAGTQGISSLPEKLRKIRSILDKSQKDMAKSIGVATRTWQIYEEGKSVPGGNVFIGLVELGVNPSWLLTEDDTTPVFLGKEGLNAAAGGRIVIRIRGGATEIRLPPGVTVEVAR